MRKAIRGVLFLALSAGLGQQALAQDYPRREPVVLPADAKAIFLAQMLGHMVALDAVVTALGQGEYQKAADIAATELGVPRGQVTDESGQAESRDLGIGRYLPEKFRAIGQRFHTAALGFAGLARELPDSPSAAQHRALTAALAEITNQCRACHDSYRVE